MWSDHSLVIWMHQSHCDSLLTDILQCFHESDAREREVCVCVSVCACASCVCYWQHMQELQRLCFISTTGKHRADLSKCTFCPHTQICMVNVWYSHEHGLLRCVCLLSHPLSVLSLTPICLFTRDSWSLVLFSVSFSSCLSGFNFEPQSIFSKHCWNTSLLLVHIWCSSCPSSLWNDWQFPAGMSTSYFHLYCKLAKTSMSGYCESAVLFLSF